MFNSIQYLSWTIPLDFRMQMSRFFFQNCSPVCTILIFVSSYQQYSINNTDGLKTVTGLQLTG